MGIFDFLTGGASKLVDSIGNAIDKNVTSDEERETLKIELKKEINKITAMQIEAAEKEALQVSDRLKADMQSDSWLSKNIRPMSLIFVTLSVMALAYITIFVLPPEEVKKVEPWTELFKWVMMTMYGFYFGSRGYEKVKK